ncbi:uncharacterized protein DDB_G0290685-like [Sebastes umbrosus]|uniref:uncharacterized protein DDB_G0290685-like n=1 Tax=Sebastes umbrosus TaxID=72105 RepID=UPI00189F655F|nr:uncharacterized protein DDB_G0290685-like [Sebastes umbrosus]
MLEWSRPDLNPRFVHLRRFGEDQLVDQNPSYKGRTSASIDRLKQGDMSLTLSKVKLSDEGTYRCFSPGLETDSSVQLVVVPVSVTTIEITKVSSGVLQCESEGWYPEPEVLWLDGEGNLLSAGPPETVRGPDDLYTVSSRVTVEKRHSNNFTCRVQQKNTNQTRETHIQVPDDFFTDSSGAKSSASTIIGLVVGILFILVVAFVVWKWRQNKTKTKRNLVDEETLGGGGERKSNSISNDSEQEALIERETDSREKQINTETPAPGPAERGTQPEQPEQPNTERAAEGQMDRDGQQPQVRSEGKAKNDSDNRDDNAKPTSEETPAPGPADRETQPEQPNIERAAEGQMDGDGKQQQFMTGEEAKNDNDKDSEEEEIKSAKNKAAGQDPTDKENNDLDQTGGQTGKSDPTPCPTERERHQDNNTDRKDGVDNTTPLSPADGPSDQLPKADVRSDSDKKDEEEDTESTNNEPADQGSNEGDTQRDELQAGAGRNTEDEKNTETERPCSPKTDQPTEEQPEKSPDSRDGEDGMTPRKENTTSDQPPTAQAHRDVEKTEEETQKTEGETHGKQRINGQQEKQLNQEDVNEDPEQEQHEEREDRRRSDRNQNVAEDEHHLNTGGDDASYSSGIPDLQHVTGVETDQQQSADDRQKGDGASV